MDSDDTGAHARTCGTPGCWKTVFGNGNLCGRCLEGLSPLIRGPATISDLMRARLAPAVDEGVTRERLSKHGQLKPLAPSVSQLVRQAIANGRAPTCPAPKPLGVFLSYASEQRPAVLRIRDYLQPLGHRVWLDVFDLTTQQHLEQTIFSAMRTSGYIVACLSEACRDTARFVFRELAEALERASTERYLYLIPILLDETEPAEEFKRYSPINFAQGSALPDLGLTLELGSREVLD